MARCPAGRCIIMAVVRGADRDLILGCKKGEARAWRRVLDRYERLVFSIPRSYGLSREDAADVSQLTFGILVQSLDTLTEESNLGAWLATVARRHTWRLMESGRRESTGRERDLAESAALLGGETAIGALGAYRLAAARASLRIDDAVPQAPRRPLLRRAPALVRGDRRAPRHACREHRPHPRPLPAADASGARRAVMCASERFSCPRAYFCAACPAHVYRREVRVLA